MEPKKKPSVARMIDEIEHEDEVWLERTLLYAAEELVSGAPTSRRSRLFTSVAMLA